MKLNSLLLKSTVVAALGGLLFGFDTAVIAGTTHALTETFHLAPWALGMTVSAALLGTILGSMLAGIPGDKFGRRDSLRWNLPPSPSGDPFSIRDVTTQKRIGLARALSKMGYCSRSQAAVLIRAGRVTLHGRITRHPESPVRFPRDRIEVDRSSLDKTPAIYLVMHKPRGVVTTASDEKGRETVYDLLEPGLPWVGPVGRLDKASEGLLLLTNDSEWAARVTEPASHLDKKYHVQGGLRGGRRSPDENYARERGCERLR